MLNIRTVYRQHVSISINILLLVVKPMFQAFKGKYEMQLELLVQIIKSQDRF